jgi:hypothetical protein
MRNALPPFGSLGSPVLGCKYSSPLIYLPLVLPKPIQDKHKDLLTGRSGISLGKCENQFESPLCYLPWLLFDSVLEVEKTQGSSAVFCWTQSSLKRSTMKVPSGSEQVRNKLRFELMKSAADCVRYWATKESNSVAVISRGANEDLDS